MGPYYADVGPEDGILMYGDVDGSIEVFEDPCRSISIGTARCIGWDAAGSAVWRLVVHDDEVPGPWLVVDREFLSTRPDWRHLYRGDLSRPRPDVGGGPPGGSGEDAGRRRRQRNERSHRAFLNRCISVPDADRISHRRIAGRPTIPRPVPQLASSSPRTDEKRPETRGSPAVVLRPFVESGGRKSSNRGDQFRPGRDRRRSSRPEMSHIAPECRLSPWGAVDRRCKHPPGGSECGRRSHRRCRRGHRSRAVPLA